MSDVASYVRLIESYLQGDTGLLDLSRNFHDLFASAVPDDIRHVFPILDKIAADVDVATDDPQLVAEHPDMYIEEAEPRELLKRSAEDLRASSGESI